MINRIQNNSLITNNITLNSHKNLKLSNKKCDDLSKGVLKQIENLKKQIEKINENKGLSQDEKVNQVKNLNEQIEELNKQLVEKQMQEQKEKRTKKVNSNNKNNNLNDNNDVSVNMDIFLEANNALHKMRNITRERSTLKSSSNILRSEAKLDKQRDKLGSATKIIEVKLSKADELEARANSLHKVMNEECAKVNTQNEKNKEDKKSINEDNIKNSNLEKVKIYIKNLSEENSTLDITC